MRYVPKWVPGAGFQHTAEYFKETVTELVEKPFAFVRHQVAAGTAEPSYVSSLLEKYEEGDDDEFLDVLDVLDGRGEPDFGDDEGAKSPPHGNSDVESP